MEPNLSEILAKADRIHHSDYDYRADYSRATVIVYGPEQGRAVSVGDQIGRWLKSRMANDDKRK